MQVVGQGQVAYSWDDGNRLTGITQGGQSVGLSYDNANRRTHEAALRKADRFGVDGSAATAEPRRMPGQ